MNIKITYISDDWSGDEESAPEKVGRKQEVSERLSPAEKTEKSENTFGNRSTQENQTNEERVNHPHHETHKETLDETKHRTVDLPQVEEDSSVTEPLAQENLKQSGEEGNIKDSPKETVPESENKDSVPVILSPSPSDVSNVQEMASIVKDSTTDQSEPDMSEKEVKTKDKGDIVLVNPDRVTPSSDSNKGKLYLVCTSLVLINKWFKNELEVSLVR